MSITLTESERSHLVSLLSSEINRCGLNTELGRKTKALMEKIETYSRTQQLLTITPPRPEQSK